MPPVRAEGDGVVRSACQVPRGRGVRPGEAGHDARAGTEGVDGPGVCGVRGLLAAQLHAAGPAGEGGGVQLAVSVPGAELGDLHAQRSQMVLQAHSESPDRGEGPGVVPVVYGHRQAARPGGAVHGLSHAGLFRVGIVGQGRGHQITPGVCTE